MYWDGEAFHWKLGIRPIDDEFQMVLRWLSVRLAQGSLSREWLQPRVQRQALSKQMIWSGDDTIRHAFSTK